MVSYTHTPTLTIAIPTYNGSPHITETIESILLQLPDVNKKIEILISDNGSTDETQEIVLRYCSLYPQLISYYRNEANLGFDLNLISAIEKAKGKYIQFLGDDDYLLPGSLKKIFTVIEHNPTLSVPVFVKGVVA